MSNRRKSDDNKKMERLRLVQHISTVLFIHKRMNLIDKKRIIKEIKKLITQSCLILFANMILNNHFTETHKLILNSNECNRI